MACFSTVTRPSVAITTVVERPASSIMARASSNAGISSVPPLPGC